MGMILKYSSYLPYGLYRVPARVLDKKTLKTTHGVAVLQCRNDNNVEKISQLLLQNSHRSLRMLANEVNIGKDSVRKIAVEDLQKQKICSRFVPHFDSRAERPENSNVRRSERHNSLLGKTELK